MRVQQPSAVLELVPTVPILTADRALQMAVELAAELAVGAAERDAQRSPPADQVDAL